MMKKLSKLALLAVAAAFLAVALPACSSGSGGEGDSEKKEDVKDPNPDGNKNETVNAKTYTVKASSQTQTSADDADTDDNAKLTANRALTFETDSGAPSGVTAALGVSNKIDSTGFNLNGYLQKEGKNGIIINGLKEGDKISLTFKSKASGTTVYPVLGLKSTNTNPVEQGSTTGKYNAVVVSDKSTTNTAATADFTITADDDYILGTNNGGYIIEFSITR